MGGWNHAFEQEAVSLVQRVVAKDKAAWRTLMVKIAPRLEGWARHNRLLKRCRLSSDDDARAVMVTVLERLAANDYENLNNFLAHTEPAPPDDDLVAEVIRLSKLDDDDGRSSGEIDEDKYYHAVGVGIGYQTVVGAIQVALGYKLNPSPLDLRSPEDVRAALASGASIDAAPTSSSRRFHLHFSIGATF